MIAYSVIIRIQETRGGTMKERGGEGGEGGRA